MDWIRESMKRHITTEKPKPQKKVSYKKISWKDLEKKLNQEIGENCNNSAITNYLKYLKKELKVKLFIKSGRTRR